ncbi:MAG: hypothetical protein ACQKBV_12855, partial [Puniceicoccales bacterium]
GVDLPRCGPITIEGRRQSIGSACGIAAGVVTAFTLFGAASGATGGRRFRPGVGGKSLVLFFVAGFDGDGSDHREAKTSAGMEIEKMNAVNP